jgi:predicted NAD/FAD-binding protein
MKHFAIIGSGISGLSAATILHKKFDITLFEANSKLGGHTNTITTPNGIPIDTGFIVYNPLNYPNFCKFLDILGVESIESNMSFSYYNPHKNEGYSSDFPWGLFSTKKHWVSPGFYKFIYDIHRFNTIAKQSIRTIDSQQTIYEFLTAHGFSQRLIHEYVIPMGAAIWSTSQSNTLNFPAQAFLSFWNNHCLLQLLNRPIWRTIKGGAQSYIDAVVKTTQLRYVLNHPIQTITRNSDGVILKGPSGTMHFDGVVIATHADQALKMLSDPTPQESQYLGSWRYSSNLTTLHSSTQGLPKNRSAWASWIYKRENDDTMTATYWMNRLQSLPGDTDYFVTLNQSIPEHVIYKTQYEHPLMTTTSIQTQPYLKQLNGIKNTYYSGSYFGNGFHEDGISASVDIGKQLGCPF